MKFPMRVFGEIKGFGPESVDVLSGKDISPFELIGDLLEIEYAGPCIDIEPLLEDIVAALDENSHGHVDCIDHENWEVLRYRIDQGELFCKKVNPDNVLEAYKWQ